MLNKYNMDDSKDKHKMLLPILQRRKARKRQKERRKEERGRRKEGTAENKTKASRSANEAFFDVYMRVGNKERNISGTTFSSKTIIVCDARGRSFSGVNINSRFPSVLPPFA